MTLTQYNIMRGEFQLTKTEVRILKFLLKNITKEFSIKSISNSIEITYPSVWESISSLKEKGVIKVREINPTQNLCSPDIKNSNNVSVFSYIEFLEKEDFFAKKQALKAIANDILKSGFPPGVLMIDDNWQEDYGKWNFHPGRFSNPVEMVDSLHQMGFKVMLWICPFVSPDCDVYRLLESKGMLLRDSTHRTAVVRWWNGASFGLISITVFGLW